MCVLNVLMTNKMHNSYNEFYSTVLCLLYTFRTNAVVHHQEHSIIYCITQFGTIGTILQPSVLMTNKMHNSYNQFYSTVFCLLYIFRTNLVVHHQEHGIIYCITQSGTIVVRLYHDRMSEN